MEAYLPGFSIPNCSQVNQDDKQEDLETKLLKMLNMSPDEELNKDSEEKLDPMRVRHMKLSYKDESNYQGEVIGDKMLRHGQGIVDNLQAKDQKYSFRYEGQFKMDLCDGAGEIQVWDSDFQELLTYKGQWSQGQFNQYGVLATQFFTYEGHF